MSPTDIVKMEDTKPEVSAPSDLNSENRDSDPVQARFTELCKVATCNVFSLILEFFFVVSNCIC